MNYSNTNDNNFQVKITTSLILITPEMAKAWLETSPGNPRYPRGNKRYDSAKVEKMVRDIKSGNWHPAGDPIKFREDGTLVDGHHRLTAIVRAGIPVWCDVKLGITKEQEGHIDDNDKRSEAVRYGRSTSVIAVTSIHAAMLNGVNASNKLLSSHEKIDMLNTLSNADEAVRISKIGGGARTKKAGSIHGIMCALDAGVPVDALERFVTVVNTGFTDGPSEYAAVVLRKMEETRHFPFDAGAILSAITQDAIKDFIAGTSRVKAYSDKRVGYYFEKCRQNGVKAYER